MRRSRRRRQLLARENVTIFEGTIRHGNLLARVDVLRKRGNVVELIEVKSKSFDPTKRRQEFPRQEDGELRPEWAAYLQDVAFQTYVFRKAYPGLEVRPFLLLVDPTVPLRHRRARDGDSGDAGCGQSRGGDGRSGVGRHGDQAAAAEAARRRGVGRRDPERHRRGRRTARSSSPSSWSGWLRSWPRADARSRSVGRAVQEVRVLLRAGGAQRDGS